MAATDFVMRDACPGCWSPKHRTLYTAEYRDSKIDSYIRSFYGPNTRLLDFLDEASFTLNECEACGLVYQEQAPSGDLLGALYGDADPEEEFRAYLQELTLGHVRNLALEVLRVVSYFDRRPAGLVFLDFGMGWGLFAHMANALGCRCYGADLSEAKPRFAESRGIPVLDYGQIADHRFDFINTEQVFEHLAHPLETLEYLAASPKPGGIIKLSVPNGFDLHRRLRRMDWSDETGHRASLNVVSPLEHVNAFSHHALVAMAARCSLGRVLVPRRYVRIPGRPSSVSDGALRVLRFLYGRLYVWNRWNSTYLFFERPAR